MPIVSLRELLNRMGSPDWGPEVRADGERLLVTLQAQLAAQLGTYIDPGPARTERAPVSEKGMIVTDHPVFAVERIDGVDAMISDGQTTLPPGWELSDHRVRRSSMATVSATFPSPSIYATGPQVDTGGLASMLGMGALIGGGGPDIPHVTITYQPGWGPHPSLRGAILTKATAVMVNKHDDTITARGLEGNAPPPIPEGWTAEEIAGLASFRSIAGPEWTRW